MPVSATNSRKKKIVFFVLAACLVFGGFAGYWFCIRKPTWQYGSWVLISSPTENRGGGTIAVYSDSITFTEKVMTVQSNYEDAPIITNYDITTRKYRGSLTLISGTCETPPPGRMGLNFMMAYCRQEGDKLVLVKWDGGDGTPYAWYWRK